MKVRLLTPQDSNPVEFLAFQFTRENVENLVDGEVKCGYYRIGTVTPHVDAQTHKVSHEFRVCYFGRSDDNGHPLQKRLFDHLADNGNPDEIHVYDNKLYFAAWICDSSDEAFEQECNDYDTFFLAPNIRRIGNGYTDDPNQSHDARKINLGSRPLPNSVYVDNINKPARL